MIKGAKIKNIYPAAFSLIETAIVLFVVSLGLLALVTLSVNNVKSRTVNKNALTAQFLAAEGLDLVRNVRDNNFLENTTSTPIAWDRYIVPSSTGATYKVDFQTFQPTAITGLSQAKLQLATSTNANFYVHNAGAPDSLFSRLITLTGADASPVSSTVAVLVQWNDQGQTYSYTLSSLLYDWY